MSHQSLMKAPEKKHTILSSLLAGGHQEDESVQNSDYDSLISDLGHAVQGFVLCMVFTKAEKAKAFIKNLT